MGDFHFEKIYEKGFALDDERLKNLIPENFSVLVAMPVIAPISCISTARFSFASLYDFPYTDLKSG